MLLLNKKVVAGLLACLCLGCVPRAASFDYALTSAGSIRLTDWETEITGFDVIFLDEKVKVSVDFVEWEYTGNENGTKLLFYETLVDGEVRATGNVSLEGVNRELPETIDVGNLTISEKGVKTIDVNLFVDDSEVTTSEDFQSFKAGVSIIPLIIILGFAVTTHMVEFSLFSGIFVGACMIEGSLKGGFTTCLVDIILQALANEGHGYVYLFILFMNGLVGMLERSGGMMGFTQSIAKYAKSSRTGQFATFAIGLLIFFDDYGNTLLAGQTMRPLADVLNISREKLSFIVDATAAPIASLTPVSSWVGFEVGLIQDQLDRLSRLYGDDLLTSTSGLAVFMQSIKYRYYPIFMLILIPTLIYSQRDFGPMLVAERKTQVYERTDGGDGAATKKAKGEDGEPEEIKNPNAAPDGQPLAFWNMLIPIILLIFFIFYLLIRSGTIPGEDQSFIEKLQNASSYSALLRGTFAAGICTIILFNIQPVVNGKVVLPTFDIIKRLAVNAVRRKKDDDEEDSQDEPRVVMNAYTCIEAYLYGMGRIFPALIILTLAWASGDVMTKIGVDRLFSRIIVGGISPTALPTLAFIVCAFVSLSTGTSFGTMAIMFPLLTVPAYQNLLLDESISDSDAEIVFYATVASVLSGAVYGDHVSPISDTTVLSALATDCNLLAHVSTQLPYATMSSILGILLGTLPIGFSAYPNFVAIILGAISIGAFVFLYAKPIVNQNGSFDLLTELTMKIQRGSGEDSLMKLRTDTAAYWAAGGSTGSSHVRDKMEASETANHKEEESEEGPEKSEEPMMQDMSV